MNQVSHLPDHVAEDSPPAIKNAELAKGGAISALVPQTLDDAFRLAKALSSAGDMVPQAFRGNPEATMAAIARGMEIGLAPMQALSNIAVINGRASLWGDALPALMQRAGHHIDVTIEGEGDKMKAVAKLTRGDTQKEVVREFSVEDAKKANLWGKRGPWETYPKRMLMHRARSWAVRDGAADALMGLQIAEEVQDYQPMRDVTPAPKPGGFAQKALEARQQAEQAEDPVERDEPQEIAEEAQEQPQEAEEAQEPEFKADPFSGAYGAGMEACKKGKDRHPEGLEGDDWHNWLAGYDFAQQEASQ